MRGGLAKKWACAIVWCVAKALFIVRLGCSQGRLPGCAPASAAPAPGQQPVACWISTLMWISAGAILQGRTVNRGKCHSERDGPSCCHRIHDPVPRARWFRRQGVTRQAAYRAHGQKLPRRAGGAGNGARRRCPPRGAAPRCCRDGSKRLVQVLHRELLLRDLCRCGKQPIRLRKQVLVVRRVRG